MNCRTINFSGELAMSYHRLLPLFKKKMFVAKSSFLSSSFFAGRGGRKYHELAHSHALSPPSSPPPSFFYYSFIFLSAPRLRVREGEHPNCLKWVS